MGGETRLIGLFERWREMLGMQDAHPGRGYRRHYLRALPIACEAGRGESVGGPALARIEQVHRLKGQLARANVRSFIAIETFALGCSM